MKLENLVCVVSLHIIFLCFKKCRGKYVLKSKASLHWGGGPISVLGINEVKVI